MVDYTDELLMKQIELDESFYDILREEAEHESEYLLECIRNNIILEADDSNTSENSGTKKVGWFKKLIEVVKSLYAKFVTKNTKLIEENVKWLKDNLSELQNADFSNLKVKVQPYNANIQNTIMNTLSALSGMLVALPDNEAAKFSSKNDVEAYGEFGKVKIKDKTFAESVKIRFYGGTTEMPNLELYENDNLKKYCLDVLVPFINQYPTLVKHGKTDLNALENKIRLLENELKKRGVSLESYSVLEGCAFKYTDLRYCYNFDIVSEAENENKPENKNKTSDNDLKVNQVVNTEVENSSDDVVKYIRWATQLYQVAYTTSLTVLESFYINGITLLKNVIKAKN